MVKDYLKILAVDERSATPKLIQLSNAFLNALAHGELNENDLLPSAIDLGEILNISTDTTEEIYKALHIHGVINATPGHDAFIVNADVEKPLKILVLFNKLNRHKRIILDALIESLAGRYIVDFHIYNNELKSFKRALLKAEKEEYVRYIVMPSFEYDDERAYKLLNAIPKEKLLLIDKLDHLVQGNIAAVYEDFEKDIYASLEALNERLSKYQTIKLLYPENSYYPQQLVEGFSRYCMDYAFEYAVFQEIDTETITKGIAYICLEEDDLILLVDRILFSGCKIGSDVGVVSYNETPIKKIIVNGVTTISADFRLMGRKAAEMIIANTQESIPVPSAVIIRNSL